MSESLDAACTPECARLMARLADQGNRLRDEVDECEAEVRHLRAAAACTIAFDEAQAAGLPGRVAGHACAACASAEATHLVRRLRTENADLLDCAEELHAGLRDVWVTSIAATADAAVIADKNFTTAFVVGAVKQTFALLKARADRLAAALARIESLGHHAPGCNVVDTGHLPPCVDTAAPDAPARCVPECPTATAQKAREAQ